MDTKNIKLMEYSRSVDLGNCITHVIGAVLSVAALIMLAVKAQGARHMISAVIYGLSMLAVYTVSAVYHGLKNGDAKRLARLIDHSTVPVLIAGTATPCALITLFEISAPHSLFVFFTGWGCAAFGIISKLFFFERLRKVTVAVYIISCIAMICSAVPLLGEINRQAFDGLVFGNVLYLIGAAFCGLGIKRPYFHVVFHIFVLFASAVHFGVIYIYVI